MITISSSRDRNPHFACLTLAAVREAANILERREVSLRFPLRQEVCGRCRRFAEAFVEPDAICTSCWMTLGLHSLVESCKTVACFCKGAGQATSTSPETEKSRSYRDDGGEVSAFEVLRFPILSWLIALFSVATLVGIFFLIFAKP
jgi:hypothetical protein